MAERAGRRPQRAGRLTAAVILLAFGAGAVDALSFAGLGAVFASVMTGNLVLLGVALVHTRPYAALAASTAIAAYVAGVLAASLWLRTRYADTHRPGRPGTDRARSRIGFHRLRAGPGRRETDRISPSGLRPVSGRAESDRAGIRAWCSRLRRRTRPHPRLFPSLRPVSRPAERDASLRDALGRAGRGRRRHGRLRSGPQHLLTARLARRRAMSPADAALRWPARLRAVLAVVPLAQVGVAAGWLLSGGRPGTAAQAGLLALAAFAMGVQSTGVNTLPLTGAATTYLTGTLTTLATELATSGRPVTMRRRFAVLAAALAGAGLDAVLITWARPAAPALPLAATLVVVLVLAR